MSQKLTQDELADFLGVTKNYLSLLENDKKDPSISLLREIAKKLKLPLVLLVYEMIDFPAPKSVAEKAIQKKLDSLINDAQHLFTNTHLNA